MAVPPAGAALPATDPAHAPTGAWGLYVATRDPAVIDGIHSGRLVLRYQDEVRFLVEAGPEEARPYIDSGMFTRMIASGERGAPYRLVTDRDPEVPRPIGEVPPEPVVVPDEPGLARTLEDAGHRSTRLPAGPVAIAPSSELVAGAVLSGGRARPIASGPLDPYLEPISASEFLATVQRLQDFQTRYSFADSIGAAADWIAGRFRELGYTEVRFDTFTVRAPTLGWNVIAVKPGVTHPERQVVIGGHYDSVVNFGHPMQWAPGADDNGSGTALTLELARVFADVPLENTLVFVAFAAEEQGLDGSAHYAWEAAARGDDIILMINSDMIANVADADPDVDIYTNAASHGYADLMAGMTTTYTGLVPAMYGAGGDSDHWPFMQAGYHAIMAHEGDFSGCWHRPCDRWDTIGFSADYAAEVIRMAGATALSVAIPVAATSVAGTGPDAAARPRRAPASLEVSPAPGRGPFVFRYRGTPDAPGTTRAARGRPADGATLARLLVHDSTGRLLYRSDPAPLAAARGGEALEFRWSGADQRGNPVAPGIYFARVEGADRDAVARVIVIR